MCAFIVTCFYKNLACYNLKEIYVARKPTFNQYFNREYCK